MKYIYVIFIVLIVCLAAAGWLWFWPMLLDSLTIETPPVSIDFHLVEL